MTASAPWSVKGIDAKAREVAKDLARRSGMTLGEWLNQMILEGQDVGALISRESERVAPAPRATLKMGRRETDVYDDETDIAYARPQAVRASAYDDRRPVRSAPFSSAAQPLAGTRDLRRSIFEDRPRPEERPRHDPDDSHELGRVARALENLGSRIENSETRSAGAVRGVSHAVESLLTRLERSEAANAETQGALSEHAEAVMTSFERLNRVDEDRGALAERLEAAERLIDAQAERLEGLSGHVRDDREKVAKVEAQIKSPQAIDTVRAVEGALGKLANQLYEGDIRARETMKDVREDMLGLSHRLTQMELRDPERAAQAVIDKVVAQMAQRLDAAEAQTSGAIKALEQAFSSLDKRLSHSEASGDLTDPEAAKSLTGLAADLSRRVEESRQEMLAALQTGQQASVEQAVAAMTGRLEGAEKRQAGAIEKMAQDVMRVADNLGRRIATVEAAQGESNAAIQRMAQTADGRFDRVENSHAQALERLGSDIARISERLNAKLTESERRTAQVLTGVGDELIQTRETIRDELGERIRQSDERTARWLEEARAKLDSKLSHAQMQSLLAEAAKPVARPQPRDPLPRELPSAFASEPVAAPPASEDHEAYDVFNDAFDEAAPEAEPAYAEAAPEPQDDQIGLTEALPQPVAHQAQSDFTPEFDPFEDDVSDDLLLSEPARNAEDDDDSDPFADIEISRKTAPRYDSGARPATAFVARPPRDETRMSLSDEDDSAVSVSTRDALAAARAAVRASMDAPFDDKKAALGGLKTGPSRSRGAQLRPLEDTSPRSDNMVTKAAMATVIAVLLVGGGAYLFRERLLGVYGPASGPAKASEQAVPIAATALTINTAPAPDAADRQNLKDQYAAALQALEAKDPAAVDKLKAVANLRYPQAEFKLAGLYNGEGKVIAPNADKAQLWTQRAAEDGVPDAMYNLGSGYYSGIGGSTDHSLAAMWFRKAAERGLKDAQYNIGQLYKTGDGVPLSPSEAYKWLSIAGKGGDHQALQQALTVKSQLSDDQLHKADAAVASFKPIDDGQPPMADSDSDANSGANAASASKG